MSLHSRILTFLYLPILNFKLLVCPDNLTYDWQMGSVELITDPMTDPRAYVVIPTFYVLFVTFVIKIGRQLWIKATSKPVIKGSAKSAHKVRPTTFSQRSFCKLDLRKKSLEKRVFSGLTAATK